MNMSPEVSKMQRSLRRLSAKKRATTWLLVFSAVLAIGSMVIAFLDGLILIPIGPLLLLTIIAYTRSSCVEEMLDLEDSLEREKA